ncbi:hypothetical protein HY634_03215 [Candidatus Uhrbacteria bacterium]|nr:hypothetical protein [Candidatus Uhrbacteria bacterium]
MGLGVTCDHDGPRGRLVRFCGACGELIHPRTTPLRRCEERHSLKRDLGYAFCVDCGNSVSDAKYVSAFQSATPAPLEFGPDPAVEEAEAAEDGGARILEFPGSVRK